jgi:hypothetical protein
MPLITAFVISPYLIATFKAFPEFGALEERSYHEIIWLQILKTLRVEKNIFRELLRFEEGVIYFSA